METLSAQQARIQGMYTRSTVHQTAAKPYQPKKEGEEEGIFFSGATMTTVGQRIGAISSPCVNL